MSKYKFLIFDLGDVLFSWSSTTTTTISPRALKAILTSDIWLDYERGIFTEDECYSQIATRFSLNISEVSEAFQQARESLVADNTLTTLINELKAHSEEQLHIFAMSNISKPDYVFLRTRPADWGIFEKVFTSADAGMRKPDLCFYEHVLQAIDAAPAHTIFVDDKLENVRSAQALGIEGIVFDDVASLSRKLKDLLAIPVQADAGLRTVEDAYLADKDQQEGNKENQRAAKISVV